MVLGRSRARDRSRGHGRAPQGVDRGSLPTVGSAPVLWFTAATGYTAGATATWADQATGDGAQDATQATAAKQPTWTSADAALNNRPSLTWDDGDILNTAATLDLSAAYTMVGVYWFAALENWNGVFRLSTGEATGTVAADGAVAYVDSAGNFVVGSPNASTWFRQTSGGFAATTPYVISLRCAGSSASLSVRRNGTAVGLGVLTGTFGMPAANRSWHPGGGWTNASAWLRGKCPEQVVYAASLSDADVLLVEQNLGAFYGITI